MLLTESKIIKNKIIFKLIDTYSYQAKNLYNACNYIIKQASRISYKLSNKETLEEWEQDFIDNLNKAIKEYNQSGKKEKHLKPITKDNSYIADSYFLSWYLKDSIEYKSLYSVCSQQIIQLLCRNWKSYYKSIKDYGNHPSKYLGRPKPPKYLDKEKGRAWLILTNQNIKVKDGKVYLPKVFEDIVIKTNKDNIQQIRLKTENGKTKIQIVYKVADVELKENKGTYMSIDLGLNNLATLTFNTKATPFIINGKPLKSINQYYNKKMSILRTKDESITYKTKAMCRLSERRNHKVKDCMHKASRKIVELAESNGITTIIVGKNDGWKQESNMGKKTNQNFVGIPFEMLIQQIEYKANLKGIKVIQQEESYTSGTSYIDGELPNRDNYDKSRRKHRGLFVSNNGIQINADVNGSYQIMRKVISLEYKGYERVERIKVA